MQDPLPRHRRPNPGLHLLLSLLVLAQGLVPLQAHTRLATAVDGQVVVICTWDGARSVPLGGGDDAPSGPISLLSPACLFSQLFGAAGLPAPSLLPSAIYLALAVQAQRPAAAPVAAIPANQRIRAPPDSQVHA